PSHMASVLAVVPPRPDYESAVTWAVAHAREREARVTVLCVWSPPLFSSMIGMAGCDPCKALAEYTQWVDEWLRGQIGRVPLDVGVTYMCRRGPVVNVLGRELERGHHDDLVFGCQPSPLTCAWLKARHRDLRVLLAPTRADARQRAPAN